MNTEPSALVQISKVYLASPSVFRLDAKAHLARLTALCEWPSSHKGTFDSWLQNQMLDFNALKAPGSTDPDD